MIDQFKEFIRIHGLFDRNESILVAVSGGVDSMVLAHLLLKADYRIGIAHCNFQLRSSDSEEDSEFVKDWCCRNDVPFHSKRIETADLAENSSRSIQMVARDERYAFFDELMDERDYTATALAHHADDRVESLLLNVLRGTGFRGLVGMPVRRDRFIRPLLFARKSEIIEFAEKRRIEFREDSSNAKLDYERNWLRLRVLPMLRQVDPLVDEKLIKFGSWAEQQQPAIKLWVDAEIEKAISGSGKEVSIGQIRSSKAPFTILKELLRPFGFSSDQVFEVLELLNSSSGATVSNDQIKVIRDRDNLLLVNASSVVKKPKLKFEQLDVRDFRSFKTESDVALIDLEKIDVENLELKRWQKGDRFIPLGMNGWKKLSDLFIDEKLSLVEKEQIWILWYRKKIVWVVGLRLDDRFKITGNTKKVLKITVDG